MSEERPPRYNGGRLRRFAGALGDALDAQELALTDEPPTLRVAVSTRSPLPGVLVDMSYLGRARSH